MPQTHSSSPEMFTAMHNHQCFFEMLGTHLQSLGQLVSRVTDGVSSPMQTNAEDLLRNMIGNNDRLHDPRSGSVTSCLQSSMMQQAAVEGTLPDTYVTRRRGGEKDPSISIGNGCHVGIPLTPIGRSREEHSHRENADGDRASVPKNACLEELAEGITVLSKTVQLQEPVEKAWPLGSKSKQAFANRASPVRTCADENEMERRALNSDIRTSGVSHYTHSSGSSVQFVADDITLETAFLVLDEQKTGRLDADRVHHVVNQYHAVCHEFTIADAYEASAAFSILQHQHNRVDDKESGAGIDFPTFSWLIQTGSLGKAVVYHGFGSKEQGHIMIVVQALRAFHDQISFTIQSEGLHGTEIWKKIDVAAQLALLATSKGGFLRSHSAIDFKMSRCSNVSFLPLSSYPSELPAKVTRTMSVREEMVISAVILFSFLMVGISSDVSPDAPTWTGIENGMKVFFLSEIVYKMRVYGVHTFFCSEEYGWNIFDLMLVVVSVVDFTMQVAAASSSSASGELWWLKLARLSRLGRLIRLLRFPMFAEMGQMLGGVFSGLRVLFWAIVLFLGFAYVAAIVMSNLVTKSNDQHLDEFRSVYWSLFTVFRCFTGDCSTADGSPLSVHAVRIFGPAVYLGYILTYLFISLGLLNLIMAVYIEEVKNSAHRRRQVTLNVERDQMEIHLRSVVAKMLQTDRHLRQGIHSGDIPTATFCGAKMSKFSWLISCLRGVKAYRDTLGVKGDPDGLCSDYKAVTREVFVTWLSRPDMIRLLDELDVDCNAPVRLFDVLDADLSGVLELEELIEGIMNLRGPIQKCDVVATWLSARALQKQVWDLQEQMAKLVR